MKMDYLITYASIHAIMGAMTLSHIWIAWTCSDISDYEDYMVTSSGEELPGIEEVPY